MEMTHLIYRKDNGSESTREVLPIGFYFGERDKVLCIDLSQYAGAELVKRKKIVEELQAEFIKSIKDSDLDKDFRSFFLDNITELTD